MCSSKTAHRIEKRRLGATSRPLSLARLSRVLPQWRSRRSARTRSRKGCRLASTRALRSWPRSPARLASATGRAWAWALRHRGRPSTVSGPGREALCLCAANLGNDRSPTADRCCTGFAAPGLAAGRMRYGAVAAAVRGRATAVRLAAGIRFCDLCSRLPRRSLAACASPQAPTWTRSAPSPATCPSVAASCPVRNRFRSARERGGCLLAASLKPTRGLPSALGLPDAVLRAAVQIRLACAHSCAVCGFQALCALPR